MAKPTTREEFKQYCLRALGHPVIEINVDDDQVEDRIDEALQYYRDYHFDASEMVYYKHPVSEQDKQNGYIILPENIMGAVDILPIGGYVGNSTELLFNVEYQFMMSEMFYFTQTSVIPYFMARQHLNLLQQLFVGEKLIRYSRHKNKLYVDMNWNTLSAATMEANGAGTVELSNTSPTVVGIGTSFTTTFEAGQHIAVFNTGGEYELHQIRNVANNTQMTLTANGKFTNMTANYAKATSGQFLMVRAYEVVDPDQYSDVWGDLWLFKYCTQKIKQQWGNHLKKMGQIQLVGGVVLNGQQIYDEATEAIEKMEDEMINKYSPILFDLIG